VTFLTRIQVDGLKIDHSYHFFTSYRPRKIVGTMYDLARRTGVKVIPLRAEDAS
jgi:EAL domain-containing protein (putative c-di-GMP-specific phosphodiesterase class I)